MSTPEHVILERYHEKCRLAGGPRPGYVLRRDAILYVADQHPSLDLEAGLDSLVEQELLKVNEEKSFYFLTGAGAEKLTELFGE